MSEPMPPRYTSAESARISVQITCEKCAHLYTTSQEIVGAARDLSLSAARANAHNSLASKLDKIRLGDTTALEGAPCPQCGYVQSWRLANRVREVRQASATTAGVLAALALLVWGLAGGIAVKPLAVAIAVLGGAVCYLLARPLVTWAYRKQLRAATKYAGKLPSVSVG